MEYSARAYQVLFDERSRRIIKNLGAGTLAHENRSCLICHGMAVPPSLQGPRFQANDGIGCEHCHGPAEKWLTTHYTAAWRQKSDSDKEALGFRPTKDLLVRARLCSECHVGTGDAEVNHDLIAAGHPRLNFEYSSFLATLPKHWDERKEKARHPDLEARVWAIGQVVSAQAALDLLAHRAQVAAEQHGPWPEFAEYDCRACHHDLTGAAPKTITLEAYKPGALRWNDAFAVLTARVVARGLDADDRGFTAALEELRQEMNKPLPDAARAAHLARQAAERQSGTAERTQAQGRINPAEIRRLLVDLLEDRALAKRGDETARQRYHALAALHRTLEEVAPRQLDPGWRLQLQKLADELKARSEGCP